MFSLFKKYVIATLAVTSEKVPKPVYEDFDIIISSGRDEAKIIYNKRHDSPTSSMGIGTYCLAANINGNIEVYETSCPQEWIDKLKD